MDENKVSRRYVKDIVGKFIVPSYQRGYRWGTDEINHLLADLKAFNDHEGHYCLQPVVIMSRSDGSFELIDGQQRFTTLYLIYYYANKISPVFFPKPKFELKYDIRTETEDFLKNIILEQKEENIDFWFISNAYMTIERWFVNNNKTVCLPDIMRKLESSVYFIWYTANSNENSIELFTRLNIGKIPLTNAELVKALFLSTNNDEDLTTEKQNEIALQWDNIERELHNESFWYFLTNQSLTYSTRIDLILDLIAQKPQNTREAFYTFFKIKNIKETDGIKLNDLWNEIVRTFLILKDWYEDHTLYHKIGYLIATNNKDLQSLYLESKESTKSGFLANLDHDIKASIDPKKKSYGDLLYTNSNDYQLMTRILLLFNVISMINSNDHQRFAFDLYKTKKWSLEHIHAQNSENLTKQEQWLEWLKLHLPSIKALDEKEALYQSVEEVVNRQKVNETTFSELSQKIIKLLSPVGDDEQYKHTIDNMALIEKNDNAALNNSAFDVKRKKIIDMEKEGRFIPYCTKLVFFKYYTPTNLDQRHFWGKSDRESYIKKMNEVLADYLTTQIEL